MLSGIDFLHLAPALIAGDKVSVLSGMGAGGWPGGAGPGGISSAEIAMEEDPSGGEPW